MTPDEIEVVAKALYTVRIVARHNPIKWDDLPHVARQSFRREAVGGVMTELFSGATAGQSPAAPRPAERPT